MIDNIEPMKEFFLEEIKTATKEKDGNFFEKYFYEKEVAPKGSR